MRRIRRGYTLGRLSIMLDNILDRPLPRPLLSISFPRSYSYHSGFAYMRDDPDNITSRGIRFRAWNWRLTLILAGRGRT